MLVISFHDHAVLNFQCLVWALLLLSAFLCPCRADDEWIVDYQQQRFYTSEPAETRPRINLKFDVRYSEPNSLRTIYSESPPCLPIGNYRNNTLGFAVCTKNPSDTYIETLVRVTISNNNNNLYMNCHKSSGLDRSRPRFQCMRFFVEILDHEVDVRVSNPTVSSCPGISVASLLYLHLHLNTVRIYGLPLQQDPSNDTLACPTSSTLEGLILINNGLTKTPFASCPIYFSNLTVAWLENQQLSLDEKPMFALSGGLVYLSLHRCSLQNIPRPTFNGLIHLQVLNISNNNISSLQKHVFRDLISLIILRIDNNALTTLDMSIFQPLKSLQFLHLSGNLLNDIDGEVAILPSLRVIELSNNKLTVVKQSLFRNSPMLAVIILSCNSISNIESGSFFNMTSFNALIAFKNILTYVNPCSWFDTITKIKCLILTQNNINTVEGIQCLSQLEVFNMFNNELSTIPPLVNLVNLKTLDLGRNTMYNIAGDEIAPATRLRHLYLDGNEILSLGVVRNSSSIESLTLEVNNLTYIPAFSFNGLQSLKTLNVSYNYIKYIGTFAFPWNLEYLGLYDNELSDLNDIDQTTPKLHTLLIGHNNLTKFNINLPNVVNFDISENPIENLTLQLCQRMPKLQDIFLEELGIKNDDRFNDVLFGMFGYGCDDWRHVSLARNLISRLDTSSKMYRVYGGIDFSHNLLKSIPKLSQIIGSIKYLYFHNCSIEHIAPMAFQQMPALRYVDLKGNDLQYFPQMSPGGIQYDLRDNPIACSCHLRWLHGHPTRRSYLFTNCIDPVTGSVKVFDFLHPDKLLCQHELNCAKACVCFGVNISTVSIVKCSSRSLTSIPPGLSPEADVIYLDHNNFSKLRFQSDMEKMAASRLFLQNSEIHFLEQNLFAAFPSLQLIDLSYNELETLNMGVFHNLNDLKKLLLHGNRINRIYNGASGHNLPNLQILTLHGNELHAVPESLDFAIRSTHLTNLSLAGNPWECTACAGPVFRKWLAQHAGIVSDAADIRCNKSHHRVLDINTTTLEYARCVNALHTLTNTHWGITAGLTVSLVLLLISLVLAYCFKDHLLVLLYNNFDFVKRRRRELDVLYDVRVVYDETDERVRQWVVGVLLHVLEVQWGLEVFLVERDMLAGGNHAEDIAQSIRQSRRTLIVVSQYFVDNEWVQFAYQAAFQFQIENNLHRVLVVAWEPVEIDTMEYNIKVYFETRQVMWNASRRFWPVLKSKLPLGREDVGPNPDNIQLNMIHND